MASNQYATDGKLGVDVRRIDDPVAGVTSQLGPAFTLGTEVLTENNGKWVYCQLPAIANAGQVCLIDPTTWIAVLITTVLAAAAIGSPVGVAPAAATVGQFGWLQQSGVVDAIQTNVAAVRTVLNTTATAGQLDDDGTAGAGLIGIIVLTTAKTVAAGVAPGYATGLAVSGVHA